MCRARGAARTPRLVAKQVLAGNSPARAASRGGGGRQQQWDTAEPVRRWRRCAGKTVSSTFGRGGEGGGAFCQRTGDGSSVQRLGWPGAAGSGPVTRGAGAVFGSSCRGAALAQGHKPQRLCNFSCTSGCLPWLTRAPPHPPAQLGTHIRAKRKREEMSNLLRKMKK